MKRGRAKLFDEYEELEIIECLAAFPKTKRKRIKGEPLSKLNEQIHKRDNNACILCGRYVLPGEKFHHEPSGPKKQDRIECGVTLCRECHDERHFGSKLREYRRKIENYLRKRYPAFWANGCK